MAGLLNGLQTVYHTNGQMALRQVYLAGEAEGDYQQWYASGGPQAVGSFEDGQKAGNWRYYDEKGILRQAGSYQNGVKHSNWIIYSEAEKPIRNEIWDEGRLLQAGTVSRQRRLQDGKGWLDITDKPLFSLAYENGRPTRQVSFYHSPEKKHAELTPQAKGWLAEVYCQDGKTLLSSGRVDEDLRPEGEWKQYVFDSKASSQSNYKGGHKEGSQIWYYTNGSVAIKGFYKTDKPAGVWQLYSPDGVHYGNLHWQLGILYKIETLKSDVTKQAAVISIDGQDSGRFSILSKKDNPLWTAQLQDGQITGQFAMSDAKGKPAITGNYRHGVREGKWSFYNTKGVLVRTENYLAGEPAGKWQAFNKKGEIVWQSDCSPQPEWAAVKPYFQYDK